MFLFSKILSLSLMFYTKIESAISHIDISILQKSTLSPAYLRHVEVPQWLHSHRKSLGALPNELPLLGAAALLRARELRRSQLGGGLRCYGGVPIRPIRVGMVTG